MLSKFSKMNVNKIVKKKSLSIPWNFFAVSVGVTKPLGRSHFLLLTSLTVGTGFLVARCNVDFTHSFYPGSF